MNRTERSVRAFAVFYTFGLQLALLGLAVVLFVRRGILGSDLSAFLAVLSPVLAGLVTTLYQYLMRTRYGDREGTKKLAVHYIAFVLLLPTIFFAVMAAVLLAKAYHWGLLSTQQLTYTLTVPQTLWGAAIAKLTTQLFGNSPEPSAVAGS